MSSLEKQVDQTDATFGAGAVIQLASLVLKSLLLLFTKHQKGVLQPPSSLPTIPFEPMVDLPDSMVDLPYTMVDLPDTMVDLTNTMVDLPDTMVDLPDNMLDLHDTMVDLPDQASRKYFLSGYQIKCVCQNAQIFAKTDNVSFICICSIYYC